MIVQFYDAVTGTPVYINPSFVVSARPDPADPDEITVVKMQDGETLRVRAAHQQFADRLRRPAA
jgi:hypothetical protein